MVANALNVAAEQVIERSAYGVLLQRNGNRGPAAAPQNFYAAADLDPDLGQHRWVAVAVATDAQWVSLREALGRPAWSMSPDLDAAEGRQAHHDLLDRELAAWCASRDAQAIVDLLWSADVPAAPVVHPSAQLGFEQLRSRRFFEQVVHPVAGESTHVTYPFRLPGVAGAVHRMAAPTLGQHNDEVLRDLVGLSQQEIDRLRDTGIIGTELPG